MERRKFLVTYAYSSYQAARKVRVVLTKIYSRKQERFPLWMQAMFVPDLTDTRFVIKPGSIDIAKKAASKHDDFMENILTTDYESIVGLDFPIGDGTTCREALMSVSLRLG